MWGQLGDFGWDVSASHHNTGPLALVLLEINDDPAQHGEKGTLLHCWECTLGQPLWRTVQRFFKTFYNNPTTQILLFNTV